MPQPIATEASPSHLAFEMISIAGGEFQMGGSDEQAYDNEKPLHRVKVPAFSLGKYPVTQALWQAVMKNNPSYFPGADRPVEQVSWEDCQEFIHKLNAQTKGRYRLPSEAEWEFAARGGVRSEGYLYAGSDKLEEVGWYGDNSGSETHPVGHKLPNELGLYDLSGNVYEWCEDDWHDSYDKLSSEGFKPLATDGSAWVNQPQRASSRVIRGGCWNLAARNCRISYLHHVSPGVSSFDVGLRLAGPPR